jgi:hypothetical protein
MSRKGDAPAGRFVRPSVGLTIGATLTVVAVIAARDDVMSSLGSLAPLQAQTGREGLLLWARAGLTWLALERLAGRRDGRAATLALAVVVSLAASTFSTVLFLPLAALCLAVTGWARTAGTDRGILDAPIGARGALVALAALVATLVVGPPAPTTPPAERDVASETLHWIDVGNPFRARQAASAWAAIEQAPGRAALVLAGLEWELGHRAVATERARALAERGRSPDVARDARSLLAGWEKDAAVGH